MRKLPFVLAAFAIFVLVLGWRFAWQTVGPSPTLPSGSGSALPVASPVPARTPYDDGAVVTEPLAKVTMPEPGTVWRSPVVVRGQARGTWFFEATFPVRLLDGNGRTLASGIAQAEGEWMTESFVPFSVALVFDRPVTDAGTIVLERSNPSGLPENAGEVRVPVRFDRTVRPQRTVQLYYYDQNKDRDASGNPRCDGGSVTAVPRNMDVTQSPIRDTLSLLLLGALTDDERARGLSTEFPLPGVEMTKVVLRDGVLTITFADPQFRLSGGSCRVSILAGQVLATARQFATVREVRFEPEHVFQP